MPGDGHVFDPLLASVINQRERQSVFVRPAELIDARALAAFRSLTAGLLDRDRIASHGVIAPDVALGINDIERAIGLHRPDGAERVGPRTGQRCCTGLRRAYAGIQEQEKNASESNSERKLYFHAVHPACWQLEVKLTFISNPVARFTLLKLRVNLHCDVRFRRTGA
jgi:hypothetical protein